MPVLQRARRSTLFETVFLLVIAAGLAVTLQAFAVKPYKIPSGSMEPTLHVHDRVLVDRFAKRILGHEPRVGDVIVFHPPRGADAEGAPECGDRSAGGGPDTPCWRPTPGPSPQSFIKRLLAVGGDTLAIRCAPPPPNGKPAAEPFIASCAGCRDPCDFSH